jgi:hypothetical protein
VLADKLNAQRSGYAPPAGKTTLSRRLLMSVAAD